MKIFIAGLTGTGKSSLARNIAKKMDLEYLPSSTLFREFVGKNKDEEGWWTHKGLEFIKERLNSDFDERFDKYLLNLIEDKDDFVIDSWTLPWLYKENALRIYLTAPFDVRVNRIMLRDNHTLESAKKAVKMKDQETRLIYLQKYNFDIFKDIKVFDLIVNTQYLNEKELGKFVLTYVKAYANYFK